MNGIILAVLLQAGASTTVEQQLSCAAEVGATSTATRVADLPAEIRADLIRIIGDEIADRDSPLLDTDAPSAEERSYPTARFVQALLVGEEWFVQIEVAMMSGVRTFGYVRDGNSGFRRRYSHYLGGPACASIKAALAGVRNPGNPYF